MLENHVSYDDEFESALPGMRLINILNVVTVGTTTTVIDILRTVDASGACLEYLNSTRIGEDLYYKLTLIGLRPQQARNLSDKLAAMPEVKHVTVEHYFHRVPESLVAWGSKVAPGSR